jgi:hypothetical protein
MTTFHAFITHPSGDGDAADFEAPSWATADSVFDDQYGGLLEDGDVITITEDGEFAPVFEWTHPERV